MISLVMANEKEIMTKLVEINIFKEYEGESNFKSILQNIYNVTKNNYI